MIHKLTSQKQKLVIHGCGKAFTIIQKSMHNDLFELVEVWDNNQDMWNSKIFWGGKEYIIREPHTIAQNITVIISSNLYYEEISKSLQTSYHIPSSQIKCRDWLRQNDRDEILSKYRDSENVRVRECLSFMESNPGRIKAFNQENLDIYDKYDPLISIEVQYNNKVGLFWVDWCGKCLYMKRSLDTVDKVRNYVLSLYKEQHPDSPHCYRKSGYEVKTGDVILDGGAAEGFWALENIEKAEYVFLVESDKEWIEALQYTFNDYRNKVKIISKWLGCSLNERDTTIDALNIKKKINYIKLDIEGAEEQALKGAEKTLMQDNIALVICAYHKEDAEAKINDLLEQHGFETVKGSGVMWFLEDFENSASLRNGLLFARKARLPKVYIWGVGKYCRYVYEAVKKEYCRLMGLVDSNKDKQFTLYKDMLVCPPEEIDISADYMIITVFNTAVMQSIVTECIRIGFDKEHIICFWKDDLSRLDFLDAQVREMQEMQAEKERLELKLENYPYEHGMESTPQILPATMLLDEIIKTRKSLVRFGDGEFEIIFGRKRSWFQDAAKERFAEHLKEVLLSNRDNVLTAIADNYGNLDKYTERAAQAIREYMKLARQDHMKLLPKGKIFYDTYVSRPYIIYQDKPYAAEIFGLWKKVFEKKRILMIEGAYSAFGCGNDLLDGAQSVKRIIAPGQNAYDVYDELFRYVRDYLEGSDSIDLILVSLGAAATCLAYDLSALGVQSIDIGQLDNEYEWYLRGCSIQEPIPNKLATESVNKMPLDMVMYRDARYQSEILARIGT